METMMKRALVLYNSKTGTTERFAREIGDFLSREGVDSKVLSIFKFSPQDFTGVDIVLLGCWTSGLMIVLQHPERTWVEFAKTLPDLHDKKVGLFTTYTLATGSMFKGMKKHITLRRDGINLELKSRDGHINESHKQQLATFLHKGEQ
jgi:flavodoxin